MGKFTEDEETPVSPSVNTDTIQGVAQPSLASSNTVIRIAIQNQIGTTKIVNFETFVDQMTPPKVIDGLMDMLMAASDRQHKRYEIIDLKKLLVQEENLIKTMQESLGKLENAADTPLSVNGKRNPVAPNITKIKSEMQQLETNISDRKKHIVRIKSDIGEREKVVLG
jgi:hypothetical protein